MNILNLIIICLTVIFTVAVICGTWERVHKDKFATLGAVERNRMFSHRGLDANE